MLKSNLALDLNYNLDELAIENLFKPSISKFLYSQIGTVEEFRILTAESYISSYDFKSAQNVSMEHIYLSFLDGINRIEKILDIPLSVFITFDKRQCSNYCSDSDRYFSSIKVGGISKVYYVLFTTDELFDFLYSEEVGYVKEAKNSVVHDDFYSKEYSNKDTLETTEIVSVNNCIKGYLDNHNVDRGLSFISVSDDSGYPIYHRDFPSISELRVGSILELDINNRLEKVIEYHLSEDKEIEGLIQFFDGVLRKRGSNTYITTNLDDAKIIFVPFRTAKDFEDQVDISVSCLARKKKPIEQNQYEWVALQVVEKS